MPHRRAVTRQDKNHNEVIAALRDRCSGYCKDKELGHHYANLRGLKLCAYDTHGVGQGFGDWTVFVSWMCLQFEVKQPRKEYKAPAQGGGKIQSLTDDEYYYSMLEPTEKKFRIHHSGIIVTVWDREQVYQWLCAAADFVLYCEGQSDQQPELLTLFFPNVIKPEQSNFERE